MFDETTLSRYAMTDEDLERAERRELKAFFRNLVAPEMFVAPVEDLFLMKLRPFRERDVLDVCLLLLEAYEQFDLDRLRAKVSLDEKPNLYPERFAQLAAKIRAGDLAVEWQRQLARRLTTHEESLLSRLRILARR